MEGRDLHARAGELFARVVDLSADERDAALHAAAQDDAGARVVSEVRRLLRAETSLRSVEPLDAGALLASAIRDYELIELCDAGGMGVVYRGRRLDPPEDVAIKVLAGPPTAEAIERFETEIELLASCDHPGIVRYRDSGRLRDGRPYLVMDWVDGPRLGPRHPAVLAGVHETVQLALHVAGAVQHLHARPALHRDLKPSNVLVQAGAEGPRPVLLDLGLARRLDAARERDLTLGRVLGTPAYMSPEQARGGAVDVTTDVYGLGAVLFDLLTGHPPRRLDEVASGDLDEVRRRLSEPAALPSTCVDPAVFGAAAAQRRARHLRGDLDAIVRKALEAAPRDRYPSIEALRADLAAWLAHRPVAARPIGALGRALRLAQRSPRRVAAGALLLAFTAGASWITWNSLVEARRSQTGLEEQVATNTAIRDFLVEDVFQQASPELRGPDTPVGEIVRDAAEHLDDAFDGRPATAVGLRSSLVAVFSTMGDLEAARHQVERARPVAAQLPRSHPQRMQFEVEAGLLAQREGRAAEVVEDLRDVVGRIRASGTVAATLLPRSLVTLGLALAECNALEESLALHEEALALLPEGDLARWSLLANIVGLVKELRGPEASVPRQEALLTALRRALGPDHVFVMAVSSNLTNDLLDLHRPGDALPHAREALRIAELHLPEDDLDRSSVVNNLASCLSALERFDEAIPLREEVLACRRRLLGDEAGQVTRAASNLATTLVRAGRPQEALEPARLATRPFDSVPAPDHPDAASAYRALGAALGATGAVPEALAAYDRALAIFERAAGEHGEDLARTREERAALERGEPAR